MGRECTATVATALRLVGRLRRSLRCLSVNIADIFRELPDRQEYEDYYQAILEPESLDHLAVGGDSRCESSRCVTRAD
jgi:hypothetical protein